MDDHTRTLDELMAGMDEIARSPADQGPIELIVRRPDVDRREELAVGALDPARGLVDRA